MAESFCHKQSWLCCLPREVVLAGRQHDDRCSRAETTRVGESRRWTQSELCDTDVYEDWKAVRGAKPPNLHG